MSGIHKDSRYRWVRPTQSYLSAEVKVWQPMLHVPAFVNVFGDPISEHYRNHNDVRHYPDEVELGAWLNKPPEDTPKKDYEWGKRWSGPHIAWVLTCFGRDVEWTMLVEEPMQSVCQAVDVWPSRPRCSLVFGSEAEIDKVLKALREA